jgi:bacterial/archaeal transporter family-2 protein
MHFVSYLIALAAGSSSPVQAGASAQLNKDLASPVWAGLWVYVSGLVGILLVQFLVRETWPGSRIADAHWWAWLGGLLSIGMTLTGLTLAHNMGSGLYTGLTLTASLLASVVLDHFGWMGFERHPVGWLRGLGAALMISGIWLIARF